LAKTGCDAADSDAADSDAADSDAADSDATDSDAAGIDVVQPGERSPPDPDVALRNPKLSPPGKCRFFVINVVVIFLLLLLVCLFLSRD